MDHSGFWLQQEMKKVESQASGALSRIRVAATIVDVVRAADIPIPRIVHPFKHQIRGLRTVESAAQQRLSELVASQIANARSMPLADAKAYLGTLRQRDWQALRGTWAVVYREADREALRVLHALERPTTGSTEA